MHPQISFGEDKKKEEKQKWRSSKLNMEAAEKMKWELGV